MADAPIAESELASYLEDERFSRKFEIPAEPGQSKPLVVTYSDYGYHDPTRPENERVLLFCSPLFGSRLLHVAKDELAKKRRIRIICPDRPGFGGTTNVDLADRVDTWLKIVPALLKHLSIKHVSIASHSGGAIYALNTLLRLRDILHPTKPYVALCAPWIHPHNSGVQMMKLASNLPEGLLNRFGDAASFFNTRLQPILDFSSGLSTGLQSAPGKHPSVPEDEVPAMKFEQSLGPEIIKRAYTEDVQGLNSDAMLLLKRTSNADVWGSWHNHDTYVPLLAQLEASRAQNADALSQATPLKVEVFFSEKDSMIGTSTGPKWFDDCWRAEQRGNRIEYGSSVVEGTDHNTVVQISSGVVQQIFSRLPE